MPRPKRTHPMAAHWRLEAKKRQALAAAIEAAAGLDLVRLGNARVLRLEAATLLRLASGRQRS